MGEIKVMQEIEAYKTLLRYIFSCTGGQHLITCRKMINLYEKKHPECLGLQIDLKMELTKKEMEINYL